MIHRIMLVCLSVLLIVEFSEAATIRVPGDQPTIQAGINAAQDGDIVLVANGEYKGQGNVNLDFGGRAITLRSENGPANCVIDCEDKDNTRGFWFRLGEGPDSVLDGFTIQHGRAGYGGGILCSHYSSPTITNNFISGNFAFGGYGGGIYCVNSATTIANNIFELNQATYGGGGIGFMHSSPPASP